MPHCGIGITMEWKGIVGIVSEGARTIDYKRRFGLGLVSLA